MSNLERVAPALVAHRSAAVLPIDWEFLQNALGITFPSDYREFADHYPAVSFDDYLTVHVPEPGKESQFVTAVATINDILADLAEDDEDVDYTFHPAEDGLIPWGSTNEGDFFFWRRNGPDPDRWPVVVYSSNLEWWEREGGMVSLLVGLIDGSVEHRGLQASAPGPNPSVELMVSAPDSQG